ncbi:MAG: hypothetical protein K8T89_23670 [Planctomycetes bacterium]|nr:hypothetical protein [Planctomycetota bacterium]
MNRGQVDVQSLSIILMCIVAAVMYGVGHDQITARVCVEYFTVGHPPVFDTDDPTLLGIGWGIIATWWVGLLLGIPLALVSRAGSRPKRSVGSLIRPIAWLLVVMAVCSLVAGLMGWLLARNGAVFLVEPLASELPADRHVPFLADLWAHSASAPSRLNLRVEPLQFGSCFVDGELPIDGSLLLVDTG